MASQIVRRSFVFFALGSAMAAGAIAGTEERCSALGSTCVCSEPLTSITHDGGNTNFVLSKRFDFDDSPDDTECKAEHYCTYPIETVPMSTERRFLPNATASGVIKWHPTLIGPGTYSAGTCHIGAPGAVTKKNDTVCMRSYKRWDPTTNFGVSFHSNQIEVRAATHSFLAPSGTWNNIKPDQYSVAMGPFANPSNNSSKWIISGVQKGVTASGCSGPCDALVVQDPNNLLVDEPAGRTIDVGQYGQKIQSMGGITSIPDAPIIILKWQCSKGFEDIGCNFASSYLGTDQNGGLGTVKDCVNNYCRIEMCLDHAPDGRVSARARKTPIPGAGPAGPQVSTGTLQGTIPRDYFEFEYPMGLGHSVTTYGDGNIVYGSHWINTHGSYNPNFWPGPACEVEGGCKDNPGPSKLLTPGLPKILQSFLDFLLPNVFGNELGIK